MEHPPKYSSPVTSEEMKAGDGRSVIHFLQTRCRVTKTSLGGNAKTLLRVRRFQQKEMYRLFARDVETGARKHRAGLIGMARKNGKSGIGSGIALHEADNSDPGGEIYIAASDRKQAGIVGNAAKAMVRMDPYLSRRFKIYANELVIPKDDTRITILSADAATKDGYNPTLVVFDEVHAQPNAELWDAMALGMGARIDPLMIGITTAGKRYDRFGQDTLCYGLYEFGKQVSEGEVEDPTFYFAWWEPKDGSNADPYDPQTWAESNPGLDDLVSLEDLESVSKRTDVASFSTKRCNMWVSTKVSALPKGAWEEVADRDRPDGPTALFAGGRYEVPIEWLHDSVLFLDGSWSGDSTGVVGSTRDGHLFVVTNYEKQHFDGSDWRVPVNSVKADVRLALESGARLLLLDPYRWQQTAGDLADEGYQIIEWPTGTLNNILPAWKDYYAAIMDQELSHDGDRAMARHHENMVLKIDQRGSRPVKEHPTSIKHIDLAICAIGAHANRHLEVEVTKKRKAWVLSS